MIRAVGLLLLCLVAAGSPAPVAAAVWESSVIHVADGDTLTVIRRGRRETIRLLYIDAPESDQRFGRESRRSLQQLVRGYRVRVDTRGKDRYGRTLAEIRRLPDGLEVNLEQVRLGLAWANARGAQAPRFEAEEAAARTRRAGLWQDPAPIPPRTWRRRPEARQSGMSQIRSRN